MQYVIFYFYKICEDKNFWNEYNISVLIIVIIV